MEQEDTQVLKYAKDIKMVYVDVGCYHPTHLNNVFTYQKGYLQILTLVNFRLICLII